MLPDQNSDAKPDTLPIEELQSDDRLLLKRAVEEVCPKAISGLYQKYASVVAHYIAQQNSVNGEARDLVHMVFLRLCQGSCRYSGQTDVRAYLCGIAKNVLKEHFRSKRRQIQDVASIHTKTGIDQVFTCRSDTPPDILYKVEGRQIIQKAVLSLPKKSRQAVELIYFDGFSLPQAAQKAGCTIKVFRARLEHGIAVLSKILEKGYEKKRSSDKLNPL